MADPRQLAAAAVCSFKPANESQRDFPSPSLERRPREPDVDLRTNKPRPCGTDLGGVRGVRVGGTCVVFGARPTRRAFGAAFNSSRHATA